MKTLILIMVSSKLVLNAMMGSESINSLSYRAEELVIQASCTYRVTNVTCKNMQHLNAELLQYCIIQITSCRLHLHLAADGDMTPSFNEEQHNTQQYQWYEM